MIKFLVFAVVLYLIYIMFFKKTIKNDNKDCVDTMIECSNCSVYVAKDDAILSNGKYFCSKECLR
jgi:uncharacterized protein